MSHIAKIKGHEIAPCRATFLSKFLMSSMNCVHDKKKWKHSKAAADECMKVSLDCIDMMLVEILKQSNVQGKSHMMFTFNLQITESAP